MPPLVFADTSALVAKFVGADAHHAAADEALRDLLRRGRRLLSTDYVFDEVVTRIRSLATHDDAATAGDRMLSSKVIRFVDVGPELRKDAWRLFKRCSDQELSFTDCTSFALMNRFAVREAFPFDSDFRNMGYVVIP
jgi:hypothetical protein